MSYEVRKDIKDIKTQFMFAENESFKITMSRELENQGWEPIKGKIFFKDKTFRIVLSAPKEDDNEG